MNTTVTYNDSCTDRCGMPTGSHHSAQPNPGGCQERSSVSFSQSDSRHLWFEKRESQTNAPVTVHS